MRQAFDPKLTENYAAYMSAGGKEPWWDRNGVIAWGGFWLLILLILGVNWWLVHLVMGMVSWLIRLS